MSAVPIAREESTRGRDVVRAGLLHVVYLSSWESTGYAVLLKVLFRLGRQRRRGAPHVYRIAAPAAGRDDRPDPFLFLPCFPNRFRGGGGGGGGGVSKTGDASKTRSNLLAASSAATASEREEGSRSALWNATFAWYITSSASGPFGISRRHARSRRTRRCMPRSSRHMSALRRSRCCSWAPIASSDSVVYWNGPDAFDAFIFASRVSWHTGFHRLSRITSASSRSSASRRSSRRFATSRETSSSARSSSGPRSDSPGAKNRTESSAKHTVYDHGCTRCDLHDARR